MHFDDGTHVSFEFASCKCMLETCDLIARIAGMFSEWSPASRPTSLSALPEVAGVMRPDVGVKIKEVASREEKHGRVITCA